MNLIQGVGCMSVGVFDAGSTGTRLKVYDINDGRLTGEIKYKMNAGGLHEKTKPEIENTLDRFKAIVSQPKVSGFYGTAGLRMKEKRRQDEILNTVKRKLNLTEAKVLSGIEEAFYALKAFEYYLPDEDDFTLIDMGGRSVQIIYKKRDIVKINSLDMGVLTSLSCNKNSKYIIGDKAQYDDHVNPMIPFGLNNQMGHLNDKMNSFDLNDLNFMENLLKSIYNPVKNNQFTFKNDNFSCTDEFFKNIKLQKLPETKKIYLISYFEELVDGDYNDMSINILFDRFIVSCYRNFNEDCQKKYYSLRFLEELGINRNIPVIMINLKMKVDISWTLGKALELYNSSNSI